MDWQRIDALVRHEADPDFGIGDVLWEVAINAFCMPCHDPSRDSESREFYLPQVWP